MEVTLRCNSDMGTRKGTVKRNPCVRCTLYVFVYYLESDQGTRFSVVQSKGESASSPGCIGSCAIAADRPFWHLQISSDLAQQLSCFSLSAMPQRRTTPLCSFMILQLVRYHSRLLDCLSRVGQQIALSYSLPWCVMWLAICCELAWSRWQSIVTYSGCRRLLPGHPANDAGLHIFRIHSASLSVELLLL